MTDRIQRRFRMRLAGAAFAALATATMSAADTPHAEPKGDALPHGGWVRGAAFSPDGKRVITGCYDKKVRVWEVATGNLLGEVTNNYPVWSVAYSPSGDTFVAGSGENSTPGKEAGEAQIWNAKSLKPIGDPMPTKGPIFSIGFGNDSKKLVVLTVCTDGTAQRWDAFTQDKVGAPKAFNKSIWCAAMSKDASTVVMAPLGRQAFVWCPGGGDPDGKELMHDFRVEGITFSNDGSRFATASGREEDKANKRKANGEVRVFEASTGRQVGQTIKRDRLMHEVALTPDGQHVLAGGNDREVELFDVDSGRRVGLPVDAPGNVLTLAISRDGHHFLAGGSENKAQLYHFTLINPEDKKP